MKTHLWLKQRSLIEQWRIAERKQGARPLWRFAAGWLHFDVHPGILPSVLVPGLDLGVRQIQLRRQFHPVLYAQVFLSLKTPLQAIELMICESCPSFSRFFRLT